MNGIDLSRFEFDYDTTWQAFFLDANLNVYSRYGGRDEESAESRLSKESLLTTMREVLEVHQRRREVDRAATSDNAAISRQTRQVGPRDRRGETDSDFHPPSGESTIPEDIPLLKAAHQGCVHCHQIQEYRHLQAFHEKKFSRELLFGFPLPENVGIRFDREHGHKIVEILAGAAAAKAGLTTGDVVTQVDDVPIHSEQDFRWALHRVTTSDQLAVTAVRFGKDMTAFETLRVKLVLSPAWRQTELGWRKSLRSVPLALGFLAYSLGREERRSAKFPEDRLAIKVVSIRGEGLASNVSLKKGDLIVQLEGNSSRRTFEEFQSDLIRLHAPGDRVQMTVLRDGKSVNLEGRFPDWNSTTTTVP